MCACSLSFFVKRLNSSSTIADEGKNTLVSFWLELAEPCWHHSLLLQAATNRVSRSSHLAVNDTAPPTAKMFAY